MNDEYDITMFSQSTCEYCEDTKKEIKKEIASGRVKVIEVDQDPEGRKLAKKLGIDETPSFLVENKITKAREVCEISFDYKKLFCKNNKTLEICK